MSERAYIETTVAVWGFLTVSLLGCGESIAPPSDGAGAPAELAFQTGPSKGFVGVPLNPAVRLAAFDLHGNVVTDFHGAVTVALGANPSGAALTGLTTVNAVDGVAVFSDLSLDHVGTGYSLTASANGLPNVTSAAFDIGPRCFVFYWSRGGPPSRVCRGA